MDNNMGGGYRRLERAVFRIPELVQTCILFSLTIFLFVFIGYRVQRSEFYSGILISEFGLIMLPALIFLLLFRYDFRSVLRLKGTRPLNFLVTFVLMLFAIPVAGVFNFLNLLLVNTIFGKVIVQQMPVAGNGRELLLNILVIAGSAGLCEEFLFRGVIQRGFERFGTARAILLAAFLFSLTHMDFQKIFGTFFLGALIGFIVYRTDSLFCGMFAHFTNNATVVLVSYISARFMSMFNGTGVKISEEFDLNGLFSSFAGMPPEQLTIVLYVYGFMFLFMISVFILLIFTLIKLNPVSTDYPVRGAAVPQRQGYRENRSEQFDQGYQETSGAPAVYGTAGYHGTAGMQEMPGTHGPMRDGGSLRTAESSRKSLLWLMPGLILIAGIYYFEVFRFTGVENGLIETARWLLGV